jgi:DNA modification methylase
MNLNLLQAIVDYVSEPGDKILDPMAGTGSIMIATLPTIAARQVFLIEDAPFFHYLQVQSKERFVKEQGVDENNITLLLGPCQDYLPMVGFYDHVIFSPPYANVMAQTGAKDKNDGYNRKGTSWDNDHQNYEVYKGATAKNLGRMQPFFFNQEAAKIYAMLFESLRVGGTMTVVVQDVMQGGKRNELSNWVMRTCIKSGFQLLFWEKRYSPGTGMKKLMRSKGYNTVDDEDVISFIRPS